MRLVNPQQLLQHRIEHRKNRRGVMRKFIEFTVDFKTGEIIKSEAKPGQIKDKFICSVSKRPTETFQIGFPRINSN